LLRDESVVAEPEATFESGTLSVVIRILVSACRILDFTVPSGSPRCSATRLGSATLLRRVDASLAARGECRPPAGPCAVEIGIRWRAVPSLGMTSATEGG